MRSEKRNSRSVKVGCFALAGVAFVGLQTPEEARATAPSVPAATGLVFEGLNLTDLPAGLHPVQLPPSVGASSDRSFHLAAAETAGASPFVSIVVASADRGPADARLGDLAGRQGFTRVGHKNKNVVVSGWIGSWATASVAVGNRYVTVAGRDVRQEVLRDVAASLTPAPAGAKASKLPLLTSAPEPQGTGGTGALSADSALVDHDPYERRTPWQQYFANVCSSSSPRDSTRAIQSNLWAEGYNLTLDGIFGPATKNAIIDWQRRQGLSADGCAGLYTKERMYNGSYRAYNSAENVYYSVPWLRFAGRSPEASDSWNYQTKAGGRVQFYSTYNNGVYYPWSINNWGTWYCIDRADGRVC